MSWGYWMNAGEAVVLFSDSVRNRDPYRVLRGGGFDVLRCEQRSEFKAAWTLGSCAVVQTDVFRLGSATDALARDRSHDGTPLVVVTERTPGNMRTLAHLRTSGIVFYDEVKTVLVPTLERVHSASYLQEVGARLRSAPGIPSRLRGALYDACRCPDPIISVTKLAGREQCDRSTLYRGWGQMWNEGELTLDQFLDWVLLLRAVPRKRKGQTWGTLAQGLSVSERTLSRTSRRILGLGLRDVDVHSFARIRASFEAVVMDRLLGAEGKNSECNRMSV
jgi:hypothetical protein